MTEEELKEMMALLEAEGWQPQLCDTQVPRFVGKASCGIPLEAGGDVEEMIPVPKALLSWGMQNLELPHDRSDSCREFFLCEGDIKECKRKSPLSAVNTGGSGDGGRWQVALRFSAVSGDSPVT